MSNGIPLFSLSQSLVNLPVPPPLSQFLSARSFQRIDQQPQCSTARRSTNTAREQGSNPRHATHRIRHPTKQSRACAKGVSRQFWGLFWLSCALTITTTCDAVWCCLLYCTVLCCTVGISRMPKKTSSFSRLTAERHSSEPPFRPRRLYPRYKSRVFVGT